MAHASPTAPGRGPVIGTLVGATAWTLALAAVCIAAGRSDLLLPLVLPLLLASLGLGLLMVGALALGAVVAAARPLLVVGATAIAIGVLLLLVEGLVAPELESDRGLAEIVTATGGVLGLPRWLATAMLLAGGLSSAAGLRRAGCGASPPRAGTDAAT